MTERKALEIAVEALRRSRFIEAAILAALDVSTREANEVKLRMGRDREAMVYLKNKLEALG